MFAGGQGKGCSYWNRMSQAFHPHCSATCGACIHDNKILTILETIAMGQLISHSGVLNIGLNWLVQTQFNLSGRHASKVWSTHNKLPWVRYTMRGRGIRISGSISLGNKSPIQLAATAAWSKQPGVWCARWNETCFPLIALQVHQLSKLIINKTVNKGICGWQGQSPKLS